MKEKLNMLHLSTLSLWPMGKNKGRVSIYLPLEAFAKCGHDVFYLINQKTQKAGCFNGVFIKKVWNPLVIFKTNKRTIVRLIMLPLTYLAFILSGIKFSLKERPDVIYSHTTETALPAFVLSKLFRCKYILRLYGTGNFQDKPWFYKISRIDYLFAFSLNANLYILTNDGTASDVLASKFGIPPKKIHFLKNGIDKDWATKVINAGLKDALAPNGEKILLTVSRIVASKQNHLIIKAIPEIIQKDKNVKLVIVGDGPEKENLERLVSQLEIDKYVHFTGAQEQSKVLEYMQAADIFLSMNALSSMSNPVFEAMICGKPVIALNVGTTSDMIQDNINGILVNPNQIEMLPQIVINLLNNSGKMESIGKKTQKLINEEWLTWEERINYEIELVRKLVLNSD